MLHFNAAFLAVAEVCICSWLHRGYRSYPRGQEQELAKLGLATTHGQLRGGERVSAGMAASTNT